IGPASSALAPGPIDALGKRLHQIIGGGATSGRDYHLGRHPRLSLTLPRRSSSGLSTVASACSPGEDVTADVATSCDRHANAIKFRAKLLFMLTSSEPPVASWALLGLSTGENASQLRH